MFERESCKVVWAAADGRRHTLVSMYAAPTLKSSRRPQVPLLPAPFFLVRALLHCPSADRWRFLDATMPCVFAGCGMVWSAQQRRGQLAPATLRASQGGCIWAPATVRVSQGACVFLLLSQWRQTAYLATVQVGGVQSMCKQISQMLDLAAQRTL